MPKNKVIVVKETPISIIGVKNQDYISLTDMIRNREDGLALIEKWLRNKNTIEFIGIWERINNPDFNSPEFEGIMKEAGLNRFILSVKRWTERTNAIGIIAKTGRFNNGTYAHKDTLIPPEVTRQQSGVIYASEADLLNVAIFGKTASEWRKANPQAAGNIRDEASLEQLIVFTNLESINAVFIRQELTQPDRLRKLNEIAISQMKSLLAANTAKQLK